MWPITASFRRELRHDSHTVAIKAEVLDSNLNPVLGGIFYDSLTARYLRARTNQFQNIIIDGSVDIDVSRDTQRTMELTILNSNGEFSPGSAWEGLFYVNRIIRLWRGLIIGGVPEFVPIGTFMIDSADVIVERNMSTVVLSGSDFWKRFSKALFTSPGHYHADTDYNTIIKAQAEAVGLSGREIALDPLKSRSASERELSKKRSYERGDNRGEFISALCKKVGIDIWFDPMGVLRTQDFNTNLDRTTVWDYYDADGGMLLSVKRSFSDDNLYNEVQCIGTGNTNTTYVATKAITSASSPLSVDKVGRRTKVIESRSWKTQAQVNAAVAKYWDDYRVIDEKVVIEGICNPALEGNDVIGIRETTYTDMGTTGNLHGRAYRLKAMSIPLSSSRSKMAVETHEHI